MIVLTGSDLGETQVKFDDCGAGFPTNGTVTLTVILLPVFEP